MSGGGGCFSSRGCAAPALPIPLPPTVRDLVVKPHDLEGYDHLAEQASQDEEEDDDDDEEVADA